MFIAVSLKQTELGLCLLYSDTTILNGRSKMARLATTQAQEFEALKQLLTPAQAEPSASSSMVQKAGSSDKGKTVQNSYWILIGTLLTVSSSSGGSISSTAKFNSASWTSLNRGFEVLCQRSFGRPNYTFWSYKVISRRDEIWSACVLGDLEHMERLFARGQASPHDSTEDGATLLHVSSSSLTYISSA